MCFPESIKWLFFYCLTISAILVTLLDMNEKPTRPPARKPKVQSAKPPMTSSQKTTATSKTTGPTAARISVTTATSAPRINITSTHSIAITSATSAPSIYITTAPSTDATTTTSAPSIDIATVTSAPSNDITTATSTGTTTANIASSVEITTATTAATAPSVDTTTQEKKRKSTRKKGMRKHKKKMGRRKGEQTDRQKNRTKLKGKPGRSRVEQPINESISFVYHRERNHGWDLIQTVLSRSGYLFYCIVILSFLHRLFLALIFLFSHVNSWKSVQLTLCHCCCFRPRVFFVCLARVKWECSSICVFLSGARRSRTHIWKLIGSKGCRLFCSSECAMRLTCCAVAGRLYTLWYRGPFELSRPANYRGTKTLKVSVCDCGKRTRALHPQHCLQ